MDISNESLYFNLKTALQKEFEDKLKLVVSQFEKEKKEQEEKYKQVISKEIENNFRLEQKYIENIDRELVKSGNYDKLLTKYNDNMPLLDGGYGKPSKIPDHQNYIYEKPIKFDNKKFKLELWHGGIWEFSGEKVVLSKEQIKSMMDADFLTIQLIYAKLYKGINWIKKYIPGFGSKNAYVDFVFDKYINDIDELIKFETLNKRLNYLHTLDKEVEERVGNIVYKTLKTNIMVSNFSSDSLIIQLKLIKKNINHPQEYYYNNYHEFFDIIKQLEIVKNKSPLCRCRSRGICDHKCWCCFGRTQRNLIFETWLNEQVKIVFTLFDDFPLYRNSRQIQGHLLKLALKLDRQSHWYREGKGYHERNRGNCVLRIKNVYTYMTNEDLDSFVKFTEHIIDLIKFIRPEVHDNIDLL